MYDIFLSYSSLDHDRVQPFYKYLIKQGWTVFWDNKSLHAGEFWRDQIEKELEVSRCAIVIWSEHSVKSKYVRDEASIAQERNILIPIALDNVKIPFGFAEHHTIRFSSLSSQIKNPQLKLLLRSINNKLVDNPPNQQILQSNQNPPLQTTTTINWAKLLGLALITIIIALVGYGVISKFSNVSNEIVNSSPSISINKHINIRSLDDIRKSGILNVGTRNNVPPMGFEKNGELLGIDIEIASKLASSLNVKTNFIYFNNINQREEWLKNAKVDVVITSYSRTEEREKEVAFSKAYFNSASVIMINKFNQSAIKNYTDLNQRKVAVLKGSINEKDLMKFAPYAEVVLIDSSMNLGYEALAKGIVDAVAYDKPMIEYYIANDPESKFQMINAGSFNPNNYAIGVSLENKELLAYVNKFVDDLLSTNFLDKLSSKYSTSSIKIPSTQCDSFTKRYFIRKGDTLSSIAFRAYNDPSLWMRIYACNHDHIEDAGLIRAGERINLDKNLDAD